MDGMGRWTHGGNNGNIHNSKKVKVQKKNMLETAFSFKVKKGIIKVMII